jgi:hypothetical protein
MRNEPCIDPQKLAAAERLASAERLSDAPIAAFADALADAAALTAAESDAPADADTAAAAPRLAAIGPIIGMRFAFGIAQLQINAGASGAAAARAECRPTRIGCAPAM